MPLADFESDAPHSARDGDSAYGTSNAAYRSTDQTERASGRGSRDRACALDQLARGISLAGR